MMRLRLRMMVAGFNRAVSDYTLARLEITAGHPRIAAPPVIDRLGAHTGEHDEGRVWRAAIRQVHAGDVYVKTGASAVARRDRAWDRLAAAFELLKEFAAGIEALRVAGARSRRTPGS